MMQGEGDDQSDYDVRSMLSYSSKNSKSYSVVTGASTGSKGKSKRPSNLAHRKVKEGSVFEEEWLVEKLNQCPWTTERREAMGHFVDCLLMFGIPFKAKVIV